jgi:hypothetical protein
LDTASTSQDVVELCKSVCQNACWWIQSNDLLQTEKVSKVAPMLGSVRVMKSFVSKQTNHPNNLMRINGGL